MSETITKIQMVELLHQETKIPKKLSKKFVEDFFDTIGETLVSGHHLKLSGFGNFYLRDKNERPGRNPKTGKAASISSRRVVTFRAGKKLREQIESRVKALKKRSGARKEIIDHA